MAPFKDPTGLVIGDVRVDWADQKGFYYPGECVAGKLFVRLDMVIQQCEKVLFMCVGESHAEWESGSGPDSATHGNHEIYFYETKIILGAQPPAKDIILNPQVIIYSFEFKLPNNLPPTACIFNHGRPASGTVLYTVRILIVTHPWGMLDSSSNIQNWVGFEVKSPPLNLDDNRYLLKPMTDADEKYLCCLCCRSGPIRVSFTLHKRLFYPGEQISFSVEVDNRESNKKLQKVNVALIASYTLFSISGKSKEWLREEVSFVTLTEAMQGSSHEQWQDGTLNVPENTVPSFDNCKCMHLEYECIVTVHMTSAFDAKVSLPVVISNGPYTAQPVGQLLSTCEEITVGLGPTASHSRAQIDHPKSTNHPLKTITEQPTSTRNIPNQPPPPPYPMSETHNNK